MQSSSATPALFLIQYMKNLFYCTSKRSGVAKHICTVTELETCWWNGYWIGITAAAELTYLLQYARHWLWF